MRPQSSSTATDANNKMSSSVNSPARPLHPVQESVASVSLLTLPVAIQWGDVVVGIYDINDDKFSVRLGRWCILKPCMLF